MRAEYNYKPEEITYMLLPSGEADVWLRKNIKEIEIRQEDFEDGEEATSTEWVADEIYFRTKLSEEEIVNNFDTIFDNGGVVVDEEAGEEVASGITISGRMDAVEAAIDEIASLLAEVMG